MDQNPKTKLTFFWNENFSAECSSAHKECTFNNTARKLDKNSKNFRPIFENSYINKQFSQKTISCENVSSHIDCSPGSLAEKTSPEFWKDSCSKKSGRKIVYWDNFFLKRFPRRRRKQKNTHVKNLWQRLSKFISTFTFSSKSSSAVIDCLLTDRQKKFTDIGAVFRSNSGKNKVLRFSLMHSFPRKNPVVTWTSVFKTMQKFYAKSQKFSRSNSETKKTISQNLSSLHKNLLETKTTYLTTISQNCSPKTEEKLTLKVRKHIKKKCLLIQISSRQKGCNFENRAKK